MYKVMMVCTGNICRSPMAEVVLRDLLREQGLGNAVLVASSGISDEEYGNPMDRRAVRVLRTHGYVDPALENHSARQLTGEDLLGFDLVLTMTASHARAARSLASRVGADPEVVRMFRSFSQLSDTRSLGNETAGAGTAPVLLHSHESELDVADPWYGQYRDFEDCLAQIEESTRAIMAHIASKVE